MHVCVCVRACTHPSSAACWFQEECWWQNRGTHCFWRLCQSPLPISLILHKETGKNTPGQAEHSQGDLGSPPRAVCAGRGNDPSLSHLVERPARSGEKLNTRWGIPAQTAWPLFLILCINWAWQWSWMWRKKKDWPGVLRSLNLEAGYLGAFWAMLAAHIWRILVPAKWEVGPPRWCWW